MTNRDQPLPKRMSCETRLRDAKADVGAKQ